MTLDAADFEYVRDLVRERAAIALGGEKAYLAEARLGELARSEGFGSLADLLAGARHDRSRGLEQKVVEAMTTNESSFFRDFHPFEAIRKVLLPELIARRAGERRLCIWSAACSSGQEPFSLSILLLEHFPELAGWDVSIVASDLSSGMLERARRGCFSRMEVNRGMPARLLIKYFENHGDRWTVKDAVRERVDFRQINLIDPWPRLPSMDLVLLRNVLIYFEAETKRDILARLARQLRPDGALLLGGAETTLNLDESYERFEVERSSCYRLRGCR